MATANGKVTKIYTLQVEGYNVVHGNILQLSRDFQSLKTIVVDLQKQMALVAQSNGTQSEQYQQLAQRLAAVREQQLRLKVATAELNLENAKQQAATTNVLGAYAKLIAEYKTAKAAMEDIAAEHGAESAEALKAAESVAILRDRIAEIKNLAKTKTEPIAQTIIDPTQTPADEESNATGTVVSEAEIAATEQQLQVQKEMNDVRAESIPIIQEQSAAIVESSTFLDEYVGSLNQNIASLLEDQAALATNKAEQAALRAEIVASGGATQEQTDRLIALTAEQFQLKQSIQETTVTTKQLTKEFLSNEGSIDELRARVAALTQAYVKMSAVEQASPFGVQTKGQIDKLQPALKTAEAGLGQFQRNVGNYSSAITNVFSKGFGYLRQLAYIIPGLGIAGIFNIALQAISAFIDYLSNNSNTVNTFAQNLSNLNDVMKEANKSAGKEISTLKILYGEATNVTASIKDREAAAIALQQTYPETFKNFTTEEIELGKAKTGYDELTKSILATSRAKAAKAKVDDLEAQRLDIAFQKQKIINATNAEAARAKTFTETIAGGGTGGTGAIENTVTKEDQIKTIQARRNKALKDQDLKDLSLNEQEKFLITFVGENKITKVVEDEFKKRKTTSTAAYNDYSESAIKAQQTLQDSLLQSNINFFKRLSDDEKSNYDTRLTATAAYFQALHNKQDEDTNFQINEELTTRNRLLSQQKLTAEQRSNIVAASDTKIQAIQQDGVNKSVQIEDQKWDALQKLAIVRSNESIATIKQFTAEENAAALASLNEFKTESALSGADKTKDIVEANYNTQQAALDTAYSNRLLSEKHYYSESIALNKKYLEQTLAIDEAQIKLVEAGTDKWIQLTNEIANIKKALAQLNTNGGDGSTQPGGGDSGGKKGLPGLGGLGRVFDEIDPYLNSATQTLNAFYDAQEQRIEHNKELMENNLELERQQVLARSQSAAQTASIDKEYDAKKAKIEHDAGERVKKQKKAELTISLASELAGIAENAARNPANAVTFGTAGAIQYAVLTALAVARYAIGLKNVSSQTFATGGIVHPLKNGKISASQNIPTQPNGDRVLATVKPGEVILNESQQKLLGGHRTFRSIGVPGFASGGIAGSYPGSSLQAPVFTPASNNVYVQNNTDFTELIGEVRQLRNETIRNHQATSNRIDKLQVYQVTSSVTSAQKKEAKQTKIGSF
jgi:hypothetical protein